MQDALVRSGVSITVYAHSSDVPANLANQHARGHSQDQSTKHLPMFYEHRSKSLVFIEKPELTLVEQKWKDDVEETRKKQSQKGIQDFGPLKNYDPKASRYAPIERNGWHELGHALDKAVLSGLTQKTAFDKAYHADISALSPKVIQDFHYFTAPDLINNQKDFSRAKQELFAELTADYLLKSSQYKELARYFPRTLSLVKNQLSSFLK